MQCFSAIVRTVIDDMPRIRHDAFIVEGKRVVAGPRAAERVALQLAEGERCLKVVCRQRGQCAAQRMACALSNQVSGEGLRH